MAHLTKAQLRGLRTYLTLGAERPGAKTARELVQKGLLVSHNLGHFLTTRGEHTALTLTHEEEQELMGLLTHDEVLFSRADTNTRLLRIHRDLEQLGLCTITFNEATISSKFRCPLK